MLLALDALHQVAASAWIGGLLCLLVVAFRRGPSPAPAAIVQRFSMLALVAVGVLVVAGGALAVSYVDGLRALVGTAYGLMVTDQGGAARWTVGAGRAQQSRRAPAASGRAGHLAAPAPLRGGRARHRRHRAVRRGVAHLAAAGHRRGGRSRYPRRGGWTVRAAGAEPGVAAARGAALRRSRCAADGCRPRLVGVQPPHLGPVRAADGAAVLDRAGRRRVGAPLAPGVPGAGRLHARAQRSRAHGPSAHRDSGRGWPSPRCCSTASSWCW